MTHGTRTELACLASVAAEIVRNRAELKLIDHYQRETEAAIKRAEAGLARASLILNAAIDEGAAK